MTDETTTAEDTNRKRGRPSIAELEAREAALAERESELSVREREAALKAAEANAAMREIDLERAEAVAPARTGTVRTDTVRSTVTAPLRRRRFHGGDIPSEFHIPPEDIPDGTSYQWNNYTVFGQQNPSADAFMQMQGWVPVPADRHPQLAPVGATGPLIVKGQILMERPQELTKEALDEDYKRAIGEVQRKEEQLYGTPAGTLPRSRANGSNEFNSVNREVVPGQPVKPNYQYENAGPAIDP